MDIFSAPHFHDEAAARAYLEGLFWPEGPICPHCGIVNHAYATKRPGVYRCAESACRKDFSVTKSTVMERSKIALHKWLQAFHLMCASKKGVSAHQLHRSMDITYEAAWFMAHRIREAMRAGGLTPLGGSGGIIESDETFVGTVEGEGGREAARARRRRSKNGRPGHSHKNAVLTLVERGGSARSFHIAGAAISDIMPIVRENVSREATIMTDEAKHYYGVADEFAGHGTVTHSKDEYVRHDVWIDKANRLHVEPIHSNTVENYYSIFKRGMKGVYQHCKEKHLHRYLAEFDFRYSNRSALGTNDGERAALAVKGAAGKRLTYRGHH
jgi:transposase-like protein